MPAGRTPASLRPFDGRHPAAAMDPDDRGRCDLRGVTQSEGKALPDQTHELLSMLQDILARARLDDRGRFRHLVLEERQPLESRLVPAGSSFVDRRLRANLYESDWADEQMGGVSYLFFLRKLAEDAEKTSWRRLNPNCMPILTVPEAAYPMGAGASAGLRGVRGRDASGADAARVRRDRTSQGDR